MPRGVPLTPEQVETIGRVYARTGNASEAAREAGVSPDAAQSAIRRLGERKRAVLYARALDRSLRDARRFLGLGQRLAAKLLDGERTDGPGMEPQHVASLLNSISRATDALTGLQERLERRSQARLTREKTRVETALIQARLEGTLPPDKVQVENLTDAELEARIRELEALAKPGTRGA